MWIILGVLLSFQASALAPFEKISNVKIIKVLPQNIVLLNKGLEDGILKSDHAKISNDTHGYSSRAICLRASTEDSHWKLYRVPYSDAFSMDYTYTVHGMADKEIPSPQISFRDFDKIIDSKEEGTTVKTDLPESP
jgi:hypothetical protein